uniref:DUF4234 domain-containing protein n=1 Tax=Meloidogyne hapla TaxID=6305 RepID=A0A1I8BBJ0_MELHA
MCASADLLQPEISQESLATVSIYNLLTVACYVTIWILMIIRKESSLTNRRLIKSLTAIIMINLAGYINDYNKAFRKTFKHLFCGKELATQTVSSTMQNRSNARNEIRMNVAKVNVTPVVNC